MKLRHAAAPLFAALLAASAAHAGAPPAPIPSPPELDQPVDGYDLRTPYQLWRFWMEGQKGAVADSLLAEPETIPGERAVGRPFLRFAMYDDFGHYLSGEIRVYCKATGAGFDYVRDDCHYRLRRAFVPKPVAGYGADPDLEAWMRRAFDAPALARHFRASGLPPQTDWWFADRAKLFSAMPSAVAVLKGKAEVVRLDSRDCPAMGKAIVAVDGSRLDLPIDLLAVGEDAPSKPPWPHSVTVTYTLTVRAEDGLVTLEGGRLLHRLVEPILDAADACERDRKAQGRG